MISVIEEKLASGKRTAPTNPPGGIMEGKCSADPVNISSIIYTRVFNRSVSLGVGPGSRSEWLLWGIVLCTLLGDVILTVKGIQLGLVEANPVAQWALESAGFEALFGLKMVAIAIGLQGRALAPNSFRPLVPLILATSWTLAIVHNLYMIALI